MGLVDPVPVDALLAHSGGAPESSRAGGLRRAELIVILIAAAVFLANIISPPSLMDDVDAVQAQISRNMLHSGDWVTARLDGVKYMEKAPAKYWMIAVSYLVFGEHDWAARIPIALSAVALCWLVFRIGVWAFSVRAGYYAGLALATCVGLFLFTRILIPDVILTLAITLTLWAVLRALDEDELHPRLWAWTAAAALATGVMLKGMIGLAFPAGAAFFFLLFTRQLFARRTWQRLHPFTGLLIFLAIAAPWHVLATLRNPPYFDFTMHSGPGHYRGFFWFYFMNEHVLRFLNLRYPRDYNTVPRLYFWLFHLLWLFPWSVYFPSVARLSYRPVDRAGRTRLMALTWTGLVLVFFTFSTTQEYYSMPVYPALALLLGCAIAAEGKWIPVGTKIVGTVTGIAGVVAGALLIRVWNLPTPGDISVALTQHPAMYTLSLGHMEDLTERSMAYLRTPLGLAALAWLAGAVAAWWLRGERAVLALALMMVVFFQAARLALVAFDPYMSSRPLAEALKRMPRGRLILDGQYYTFSSVFFYAGYDALLLNGRVNNLEYGSYAPGAPHVFIDDAEFRQFWLSPARCYLLAEDRTLPRIEKLVGQESLHLIRWSGGKSLLSNRELALSARAGWN
jgi:4-amino-4-deoxy-L-arabinose transferase-like glycosyltransferase